MATQALLLPAPPKLIHNWHRRRVKDPRPQPVVYEAWPLVDRLAVLRMPQTFQTFGVEMELLIPGRIGEDGLKEAISTAAGNDKWQIKEDASLYSDDDGYIPLEVITPVLTGTDGLLELVRVCKAINKLQPDVNASCGLHVHVGCGPDGNSPWELSTLRRVAYNWLLHEPAMDLLVDPSRRAALNEFCVPLRTGYRSSQRLQSAPPDVYKQYQDLMEEGVDDISDLDFPFDENEDDSDPFDLGKFTLLRLKDALKKCCSETRLMFLVSPYGRRYKLNLHSIERHNTVEFRHPAGSWDASEVAHYALLYMRFLESSAMSVGKPYTLPYGREHEDDPLQYLMDDIYCSDSLLDEELQLWIRHKADQLARQPCQQQRINKAVDLSRQMFQLPVEALI